MAHRRATSADVAQAAGVSRTTVSFVLNGRDDVRISDPTRERVLDAARRLGYRVHAPARTLAGGLTRTLGLVFRQSPEQVAVDALLPETLRGLMAAAQGAGYRVLVESVPDGASYADLLHLRQVDGLVISGPRADDAALEGLDGTDLPIVVQGWLPGAGVPCVDVDNVVGARQAVEHLIALGHRRIGCITHAPLAYTAARERLAGYREALAAAHLPVSPALEAEGDFDPPSGHRAMAQLLERGQPFTAVFAANDMVALGAIGALRLAGRRVPQDVSVVGFDDVPVAAFFDPALTTVRLPARELGAAAGRILLDRVADRPVPSRTLLATELIVRASAGAPRPDARGEVA